MNKKLRKIPHPVALITGGAQRIGAAISADLAAHGFAIAVHYHRSSANAEKLCAEIVAKGGIALPFHADLRTGNPTELLASVTKKLGSVRLLVNNASLFQEDAIGSLEKTLWDDHFKLHLEAPVFLAEALLQTMNSTAKLSAKQSTAAESALIVNIIDQRVLRLNPLFFSYTLSKSALWTATQTLAQALAPHIRVNAVSPGPTLKNERQTVEDFQKQCATLPLHDYPKPEDIGKAIRFLWEMPTITGQMLTLDSGQHLIWETADLQWDTRDSKK